MKAVFAGNIIKINGESWTVTGFTMTSYKVYNGRLDITKEIPRHKVKTVAVGVHEYSEVETGA